MELIKPIQNIKAMFDKMNQNDQQCPHVAQRLDALEKLAVFISKRELGQLCDDVNEALGNLKEVLSSADELILKFNKAYKVTHMVKSGDYKSEFDKLNKSLTDAFVTLSGALHILQGKKLEKQELFIAEQDVLLQKQKKGFGAQKMKLTEQDDLLHEQKKALEEQRRKLAEQEDKLAALDDTLQRVQSDLQDERRGYYCVLQ